MADLLDIVPATAVEAVHISGNQRVTVRALNSYDVATMAARFPALVGLLVAAGNDVAVLISSIGVAVGPIIAAGCGRLGDEKAEAIAGSLLIEDQIKLVKAIIGLTFPKGLAAFMEAMASLVPAADAAKTFRVRLKKSPSPSPPSSGADSRPIMQ